MKARSWWVLGVCLAGGVASAQDTQPTVVPFPLELKSASATADKEQVELQATWRKLLRVAALVPDTGSVETALKESGRRDCEREDECLKALALKAGTLYAAYANVGMDLTRTKVVATGRIVRDDGKRMGEIRTTTVDVGPDGFIPAAKVALGKLVEYLEVAKLSPVRPVDEPVVAANPPPTPPPAVTADRPMSGGKVGGVVLMAGGVAVLGLGVGLLAGAAADTEALAFDGEGRITAPATAENVAKARSLGGLRAAGGVLTGVGAAAAVAGLVVFLVAGNESPVAVGATPLPGGFAATVGGTW